MAGLSLLPAAPLVAFAALALPAAALALTMVARRAPRSDRDWAADHSVPARVVLTDAEARIENLRDFRHGPEGTFTPRYQEVTVRLAEVRRVWFVLALFGRAWRGFAHTFLSFELTGSRFIAVSVEARRERHETYSIVGGLLRAFEVTYVVGTEADLVGLRALRGDTLFLYPSRATPEQARALFADMLSRAEALRTEPEFYHTLTRNCATVLREHVNRVAPEPLPFGWAVIFPGYSDALGLEHRLLDTELPIDRARVHFRVDERARHALATGADGDEFSRRIRERPARSRPCSPPSMPDLARPPAGS